LTTSVLVETYEWVISMVVTRHTEH